MATTFEQIIDLFKKTNELRQVVLQYQTNPAAFESIKTVMVPALEVLLKQFEEEGTKEEFKETLLKKVTEHYSQQIDTFFEDIETLKNFVK